MTIVNAKTYYKGNEDENKTINIEKESGKGLGKMNEATNNMRIITIKSESEAFIVRLASKLLVGYGRWTVTWGKNSLKVEVPQEHMECLAKYMTKPVMEHGIELHAANRLSKKVNFWELWTNDFRFRDMLASEELYEKTRAGIFEQLICADVYLISVWIKSNSAMEKVITDVEDMMQSEGGLQQTMVKNGWI